MKTTLTTIAFLLATVGTFAQTRTLDITGFSELSLGISANLYLEQGVNERIEVSCDDDIFQKIEFELRGSELVIKKEGRWNWKDGWKRSEVDIYVTMKDVEELSVSGSGTIEGKGTLNTEDLRLSVSGSGDMDLDLDSDELDLRISGSGSIRLNGIAEEAEAKISGSGRIKADDLSVKSFKASISGSGSCYITATQEISANISGSGNVYYQGEPSRVNSNSSGSGKIRKM